MSHLTHVMLSTLTPQGTNRLMADYKVLIYIQPGHILKTKSQESSKALYYSRKSKHCGSVRSAQSPGTFSRQLTAIRQPCGPVHCTVTTLPLDHEKSLQLFIVLQWHHKRHALCKYTGREGRSLTAFEKSTSPLSRASLHRPFILSAVENINLYLSVSH